MYHDVFKELLMCMDTNLGVEILFLGDILSKITYNEFTKLA